MNSFKCGGKCGPNVTPKYSSKIVGEKSYSSSVECGGKCASRGRGRSG